MGIKYLLTTYNHIPNHITFPIKLTITIADDVCSILLNVAIHNIRSITIKSWTINIPILNLPGVDSISSLSLKSFNTTMVLLNANPIDKNIDVMVSNHSIVARKYPSHPVIITWNTQAIVAVLQRSLIIVGFNSIPTIKSSNAIPKFPND